jgi:hypothetical protein
MKTAVEKQKRQSPALGDDQYEPRRRQNMPLKNLLGLFSRTELHPHAREVHGPRQRR